MSTFFSLPQFCHLEMLTPDDLPRLIEQRKLIYQCMDTQPCSPEDFACYWGMMLWATEQIVYLKLKYKKG